MSGRRFSTFREGDRSEYLAQYLLSSLGLVTAVPRQEDIGFDFVCSVADQEVGNLTFNHQYVVSVKSRGTPRVQFKPFKGWDGGYPDHIDWLFRLDLPFMLALADKRKGTLALYSTLPIWFIRYAVGSECGSITLVPRVTKRKKGHVGMPQKRHELKQFPGKFHFEVDLGDPILTITREDASNPQAQKDHKRRLRWALGFAERTIRNARFHVPFFYWLAEPELSAYFCHDFPINEGLMEVAMREVAPVLVTMAMHYQDTAKIEEMQRIGSVLRLAPPDAVPMEIKRHLKAIFAEDAPKPDKGQPPE